MTFLRIPKGRDKKPSDSSHANRGKVAEKEVETLFKRLNCEHLKFAWHRYPDTRAARGFIAAQPADYLVSCKGEVFHLEVKETKHDYRLTSSAFPQLPTLKKFALAGLPFYVLVHHSTSGKWRCLPQAFFDGDVPASWPLQSVTEHTSAEEAMRHWCLLP